jgi:xanthine dehydrogenase YagR molybdenum-binding subunit
MTDIIGQPIDRKDGKQKVTGTATYAAEWPIKNIAYGVTVQSTITKGNITNLDTTATMAVKGVLGVLTHQNAIPLHKHTDSDPQTGKFSEKDLLPLQGDEIFYNGQHIAVVIAETFEIAEYGASLLKVSYYEQAPVISISQPEAEIYQPSKGLGGGGVQVKRGNASEGMQQAQVSVNETYFTPVYHHNPMEPHATAAEWNGDELTVYDSTQSVFGNRSAIANMLSLPPEKVRVISPFIGGGFGSKGFMWANSLLAPMAARLVKRPVKVVLQRTGQMFTCAGRRSFTIQKIGLGVDNGGKFTSVNHDTTSETSFVDEFVETAGVATKMLYATPNLDVSQNLVKLNKGTPCPTRAPGEAPGTYALEVAMDELAYKLNIDPLQLRLVNYAETEPQQGKKWSSKNLRECYERGAKLMGWESRNKMPGTTKEGKYLVGYGMATATYPANRGMAKVRLKLFQDGHAVAACCTQDIGTGTYTVMAQVMAEALGLPVEKVEFKLGDTIYPQGPNSGGSQTMASTGPAVQAAALTVKSKAIQLAIANKKSPLFNKKEEEIAADNGRLFIIAEPGRGETYTEILTRNKMPLVEAEVTTNVSTRENQKSSGKEKPKDDNPFVDKDADIDRSNIAFHSFGAFFVKVLVDPLIGKVKVDKVVGVMDVGTILNSKTAKSQIMGGAIFGIGMALMEETVYDPNSGRIVTKDLADYLVPVHADMPEFVIEFTNVHDDYISPVGARGAGEIGITGITAAIINAVYHATGKRIRELPVTPDKLLL